MKGHRLAVPDTEVGPDRVTTAPHQLKAEFFKMLSHPVRIRVLELLSEREHALGEMLPAVGVETKHPSQQLAARPA
jgi:hypothetical protein